MATQARKVTGSGSNCAVHGCKWSQKKLNELLNQPCFEHKSMLGKDCPCDAPFKLHKLPDDPDLRRQWLALAALNRKIVPQNVFVCSYHFLDKKPTPENPLPELFLGYEKTLKKRRILVRCKSKQHDNETTPVFSISGRRKRKASSGQHASPQKQLCTIVSLDENSASQETVSTLMSSQSSNEKLPDEHENPLAKLGNSTSNKETQWEDFSIKDHDYFCTFKKTQQIGSQCKMAEEETISSQLIKTDSDANMYVGIPRQTFWTLTECMKPFAPKEWQMPVEDQVLMTLMKLKLNLLFGDLARRFGVSVGLVSKTVKFWLEKLAAHLRDLIVWLPRETIRATMPSCFKRYPKTTCIMDCAETIMQKSSNLKSRGESYSNYKSHNTVKYCVTIAPSGLIMHISKAYGGRASDKFIVQDSGVLEKLLPGDEVMADRGFTIQDLLFPRRVKLNIPAFSHGKQLSNEEVTRTRRLANVRIHVERAIRRLKVFKILRETVSISFIKHIDQILTICAALVNLKPALIKDKDES